MQNLVTSAKIHLYIQTNLLLQIGCLLKILNEGDLLLFEKNLKNLLDNFYNYICDLLLNESASQLESTLRFDYKQKGFSNLKTRPFTIQIATGYTVNLETTYAGIVPDNWKESRYPLSNHWGLISKASIAYIDKVCLSSVIAPSYSTANEQLKHFGINQSTTRVRKLVKDVSIKVQNQEVKLSLKPEENLEGKRVVIALDGGRTRTRKYEGKTNEKGNAIYETPWCEPKMLVINVIDEKGEIDKKHLPIYGTRFSEEDILSLLKEYLSALKINKASQVQILADGAKWIWNNVRPILIDLGVAPGKIIETLDYCHAVSYVHKLVDKLPSKYSEKEKSELKIEFKDKLWNGKSDEIVKKCRNLFKRKSKEVKRWINYLDRHQKRTQYADFKENRLMCGSGIVESGIRRIINLRFKNASTFWKNENVEKLFFFRSTFLSFRWGIFINNLNSA